MSRTISSVGRALASHARGRWFKSSIVHQISSIVRPSQGVHPGWRRFVLTATVTLLLPLRALFAEPARPDALPPRIPPGERVRLNQVVESAFVSTHMQLEPYAAQPDLFEYLLDHPVFATHLTRALRLARYRIWRTPEGLFLDDGWGAKGHFEVVHAEAGLRVMYAKGAFEQPILPTIRGRAVVVIEYEFRPAAGGRQTVATAATGYVTLDSRFPGFVRWLATPMAQAKADREARMLLKVFARVSQALNERPDEVYEKLAQRPDVPRQELEEFRRLMLLHRR